MYRVAFLLLLTAAPCVALDLVLFGDWGAPLVDRGSPPDHPRHTGFQRQQSVARALAGWMRDQHVAPDAIILLGDNFYTNVGADDDPRWHTSFIDMYPRASFPMPFYFVMGNHDYEDGERHNWLHEMQFHGDDRWHAPASSPGATWARVDLPAREPVLSLYLVNNVVDGVDGPGRRAGWLPWKSQLAWLSSELAHPTARWIAAASHYPPYSNGAHHKDDGPRPPTGPWINDRGPWLATRRDLLPRLTQAGAQFWFAGHDHNLQHLRSADWPGLDILVSGGGGGDHPYGRHPLAPKEPLLVKAPGWLHMHFDQDHAEGRFWYLEGTGAAQHLESAGAFERRLR